MFVYSLVKYPENHTRNQRFW